mmetsp:Transcript_27040/g.62496  ORF Transcript_27040/g.62496 Transcript_27040/m.62496 type:complete len:389 (-) Transcript_27040:45-1211(-)
MSPNALLLSLTRAATKAQQVAKRLQWQKKMWKLTRVTVAAGTPFVAAAAARNWRSLQDIDSSDLPWPESSPVQSFQELRQIAERASLFKLRTGLDVIRQWHVDHGYTGGVIAVKNVEEGELRTESDPPRPWELCYFVYYELAPSGRLKQEVFMRGTSTPSDLRVDLETKKVWDEELGCYFHSGFLRRANDALRDLEPLLQRGAELTLSGHSLGGAVAAIVGLKLQKRGHTVERVISFGAPKFTTVDAVPIFRELALLRVCHEGDVVVGLPLQSYQGMLTDTWTGHYHHVGQQLLLGTSDGEACYIAGETSCQWWNQCALFMLSPRMIRCHMMPTYMASIQELRDGRAEILPYNASGARRLKRLWSDEHHLTRVGSLLQKQLELNSRYE